MAGTKAGGAKTFATTTARYGADFYKRIGRMGGLAPKARPGGFATMTPEQRSAAGRKGGAMGRRSKRHA